MISSQRKGDIAVAQAVAAFTRYGYNVSIPLTESASYDLIVENGVLNRVQVKYTSTGEVDLRRIHSNSQGYVVKEYAENAYDWLFVYFNGNEYLITDDLYGRKTIKINDAYLMERLPLVTVSGLENQSGS